MIYLLDTNAFSDLMAEHQRVKAHIAGLADDDQIVICTTVRGEILYGIERLPQGRRRRELEAKAANLFTAISCESIPAPVADHYAMTKANQQRKGLSLDENDLWIAATAIFLGAVLVSRDLDMQRIEGLAAQDWTV